ncbi:MAG: Holliday junction branch migration protein RuvA [Anaerococcus sp.]|nr:Holliday junction branch migration protein RuvA [Anaerococcus sp.]MDD7044122.1 Holliday junction branch migration protein RuvA [Peptoniphilaceae bacterium]MDY2918803.1 Holliday junction branch migration protein RuvA [Anaerococcus sp.]
MISYIIGTVRDIREDSLVIENNNIGYLVHASLSTLSNLEINNEYKIYTHMNVREDDLSLFGFISKEELEMFIMLIGVSSIGPKVALGILSSLSVNEIKTAIVNNDIDKLTKAKGVGKKSASRIILELVDAVKKMTFTLSDPTPVEDTSNDDDLSVAREALVNLGYQKNDIDRVLGELRGLDLSLEELVKESLKRLI